MGRAIDEFSVLFNQIHDLANHDELTVLALSAVLLEALGVVLGQVRVHPDPDMSSPVYADVFFHYGEIANGVVELFEAEQNTLEDVDVFGEGDVGDVAEADRGVLDEDEGAEEG